MVLAVSAYEKKMSFHVYLDLKGENKKIPYFLVETIDLLNRLS